MNSIKAAALSAAFGTLTLGAAHAAEQTFMFSVPDTPTNFSNEFDLPQFDPSLGTLQEVQFTLEGEVNGSAAVENTSTSSGTDVSLFLQATITLTNEADPMDPIELVVILPTANENVALDIYDGTTDFDGASGASFENLNAMASETEILTSDFSQYIGVGTVKVAINAEGTSDAEGGGNLILSFVTSANGKATVTYVYETPDRVIPVPGALLLMGTAVAGFGLARRRKA